MFYFRCDKNFRIEGVGARMDSTMLGSNGTSASDLYTRVMVDLRDPRWSIIDADDEVDTDVGWFWHFGWCENKCCCRWLFLDRMDGSWWKAFGQPTIPSPLL